MTSLPMDQWPHTTRHQYRADRPVGIDLFDCHEPDGLYTAIYARYTDGTRSPARTVATSDPEHHEAVLAAWCEGKDVRDYRKLRA